MNAAKATKNEITIGKGCGKFLSYGGYELDGKEPDLTRRKRLYYHGIISTDMKLGKFDPEKISEEVKHSWYADSSTKKHPAQGETSVHNPG